MWSLLNNIKEGCPHKAKMRSLQKKICQTYKTTKLKVVIKPETGGSNTTFRIVKIIKNSFCA